ncbi:MAG: hypothetical protein B6242_04985 [Anaerolineaceae bacterium 4572_78]|nr:MAG: hypothetical protein B6242_04985 [Anaerolineaceae bacterium 4572_78]
MKPKYSFPSGHSARIAAFATSIYFFNKPLGCLLGILAIIIALARVRIGIHYVADVIAGLILGAVIAKVMRG